MTQMRKGKGKKINGYEAISPDRSSRPGATTLFPVATEAHPACGSLGCYVPTGPSDDDDFGYLPPIARGQPLIPLDSQARMP